MLSVVRVAFAALVLAAACGAPAARPPASPTTGTSGPSSGVPPASATPAASATAATSPTATTPDESADAPSAEPAPAATTWLDRETPLPAGWVVLHVGDSMADALGRALEADLEARALVSHLRFETASYIPNWSGRSDLSYYVRRWSPDLVIVTLGTNELQIVDAASRAPKVEQIVGRVGERACVWILPPRYTKDDNGLRDVIRAHSAPCQVLDPDLIYPAMPKIADGVHPTGAARTEWSRRVVRWLSVLREPGTERPWRWRADADADAAAREIAAASASVGSAEP